MSPCSRLFTILYILFTVLTVDGLQRAANYEYYPSQARPYNDDDGDCTPSQVQIGARGSMGSCQGLQQAAELIERLKKPAGTGSIKERGNWLDAALGFAHLWGYTAHSHGINPAGHAGQNPLDIVQSQYRKLHDECKKTRLLFCSNKVFHSTSVRRSGRTANQNTASAGDTLMYRAARIAGLMVKPLEGGRNPACPSGKDNVAHSVLIDGHGKRLHKTALILCPGAWDRTFIRRDWFDIADFNPVHYDPTTRSDDVPVHPHRPVTTLNGMNLNGVLIRESAGSSLRWKDPYIVFNQDTGNVIGVVDDKNYQRPGTKVELRRVWGWASSGLLAKYSPTHAYKSAAAYALFAELAAMQNYVAYGTGKAVQYSWHEALPEHEEDQDWTNYKQPATDVKPDPMDIDPQAGGSILYEDNIELNLLTKEVRDWSWLLEDDKISYEDFVHAVSSVSSSSPFPAIGYTKVEASYTDIDWSEVSDEDIDQAIQDVTMGG